MGIHKRNSEKVGGPRKLSHWKEAPMGRLGSRKGFYLKIDKRIKDLLKGSRC